MAYKRKTYDIWEIQGFYSLGRECVAEELSLKEGKARLKDYLENEGGTWFRLKKKRQKLEK